MKKSLPLVLILFLAFGVICRAGGLSIDSRAGSQGDAVVFSVSVENAPNQVNALIMDLKYDPGALTYTGYERGALRPSGYPMLIVNEYKPGTIRVGAVDPLETGIAQGDTGSFLRLKFQVTGDRDSSLSFGVLKDDLQGWSASPGYFTRSDLVQQDLEEEDPGESKDDVKKSEDAEQAAESEEGAADQSDSPAAPISQGYGGTVVSSVDTPAQAASASEASQPENQTAPSSREEAQAPLGVVRQGPGRGLGASAAISAGAAEAGSEKSLLPGESASLNEKIAAINSYRNGLTPGPMPGSPNVRSGQRAPGKSPALQKPSQTFETNARIGDAAQAAGGTIGPEWIYVLIPALLTAVLVLVTLLLIVLAGILLFLVLIYLKLRSLEKSGRLVIQGPVFSWSAAERDCSPSRETYVS